MPQFVVPASRDLDAFRSTLLELEASVSHLSADLLAIMSNRVSDLPGPTGGIMLKSATGATLIVNDTGIYIQNGKGASITLLGPSVTINNGALMVT